MHLHAKHAPTFNLIILMASSSPEMIRHHIPISFSRQVQDIYLNEQHRLTFAPSDAPPLQNMKLQTLHSGSLLTFTNHSSHTYRPKRKLSINNWIDTHRVCQNKMEIITNIMRENSNRIPMYNSTAKLFYSQAKKETASTATRIKTRVKFSRGQTAHSKIIWPSFSKERVKQNAMKLRVCGRKAPPSETADPYRRSKSESHLNGFIFP